MAYSKVRWISTPAFLACIGGAHDKGEGVKVRQGARTVEVKARMAKEGGARLRGAYAPWRQPYAPRRQPYAPLNQPYAPHNLPYAPLI
jgi:hypothetical protein